MKKPETICIFGDSTAWGAWDLDKGGWVSRLWLDIHRETEASAKLYNLSISGGTTETILARFESEARMRDANGLIFQTGGNDASFDGATREHQVSIEQFEKNIEEVIRRAKKMASHVAFIGFKNCDESRTTPVYWCNYHYTNADIERYNGVMKAACERNMVPFLDIFGLLENTEFEDGLHPNAQGHQKIFETVQAFLTKEKWI